MHADMDDEINFLIWTSPPSIWTSTREWIEEAVGGLRRDALFVSHDRYFINRSPPGFWELADGTITDYLCGFANTGR